MAIKELFYDQRPVALINPRESLRIDPRFRFTRPTPATYYNRDGLLTTAQAGEPRFAYNPETKEFLGLQIEPGSENLAANSLTGIAGTGASPPAVTTITETRPDGTVGNVRQVVYPASGDTRLRIQLPGGTPDGTYIFSCFFKKVGETDWYRVYQTVARTGFIFADVSPNNTRDPFYASVPTLDFYNETFLVTFIQAERVSNGYPLFPSSFILTDGLAAARPQDLLTVDSVTIPPTGSLYVDAQASTVQVGSTLASVKNISNQKINLGIEERAELYNSPALVYSIQNTVKPTLPFPVPTTFRERNIITWGANNYQYTTGSARFAQSLSGSVPANLTQLSIGSDSVDPTKAFNGYINAAYLYSGEITPAVAEALVRGELDPVNADTFVPSGPAGSLSIVVNTQGAASDGDRVFELPAESVANDNDIVITWGDGTESGLENAAAELGAPGLTKTYSSAGIYPIFVEGQLENLKFNNIANAPDLVQIVRWGTTANGNDVFLSPSTLNSAFYGCSQLDFSSTAKTTNLPDTSGVTDWFQAFRGCSSITGMFPQFNFSSATTLERAFQECSSITSFTPAGTQTQNVTNFGVAWFKCSSLTSFPLIDTSSATTVNDAWRECSSLTAFPLINTGSCTNFNQAWFLCTGLTSFPLINTSSGISFASTWNNCDSLTSFPLIDTSSGTDFTNTWARCRALTSFPLLNTSSGTIFNGTWVDCNALTSFPLVDTSSGTNFRVCWQGCFNLASFPLLDTSSGTNFLAAWTSCSSLTSFPAIDTSAATTVNQAWYNCTSLTSFPALDFGNVTGLPTDPATAFTGFVNSWRNCSSLANFPANLFNTTTCTSYFQAFLNCALTVQSIENILVSIESANTSNGVLSLEGGTNAAQSTWSTAATTAYNALVGRGWTITFNP